MISFKLTVGDVTLLSVTLWESEDEKLQRVAQEVEEVTSLSSDVQYTEAVELNTSGTVGFFADIVSAGVTPGAYEESDDDRLTRGAVRRSPMGRR
jgi:hypothetical protein